MYQWLQELASGKPELIMILLQPHETRFADILLEPFLLQEYWFVVFLQCPFDSQSNLGFIQ